MYNDGSMDRVNGPRPLTTICVGAQTMAAKKCSKCGIEKPLSCFSPNGPGLRKARCKPCRTEDEAVRALSLPAEKRQKMMRRIYEWQRENIDKWKVYAKKWREANKPHVNLQTQLRRRRIRAFTPMWADKNAIRNIYKLAQRITEDTGIPHEVDHIVPLNSDLVCGLHWEGNLQVIPEIENKRKTNILWPHMPTDPA